MAREIIVQADTFGEAWTKQNVMNEELYNWLGNVPGDILAAAIQGTDSIFMGETFAWDIDQAAVNASIDLNPAELNVQGLFFAPVALGSFFYTIGDDLGISYYDLLSPGDLNSAWYWASYDPSAQDNLMKGIEWDSYGTKVYLIGQQNNSVYEYDIDSGQYDIRNGLTYKQAYSVNTQESAPTGVRFKPDGYKMYVIGGNAFIYEYNLSTPWDILTAVYSQSFDVSLKETSPEGLCFKPDGSSVFIIGTSSNSVHEYELGTPWDVSTAVFVVSKDVSSEDIQPRDVGFSDTGLQMYIAADQNDAIVGYIMYSQGEADFYGNVWVHNGLWANLVCMNSITCNLLSVVYGMQTTLLQQARVATPAGPLADITIDTTPGSLIEIDTTAGTISIKGATVYIDPSVGVSIGQILHIAKIAGGNSLTIRHNSGSEPDTEDRFYTKSGADIVISSTYGGASFMRTSVGWIELDY